MNKNENTQEQLITMLDNLSKKIDRLEIALNYPKPKQLKTKQACKYLDCSINTLNKICIEYNIPSYKIGGANYYLVEDFDILFKRAS